MTADGFTEFLAACYDEAEAKARAAARKRKPPWRAETFAGGAGGRVNNSPEGASLTAHDRGHVADAINGAVAEHIASVDPAHRLADIRLKRAILAGHKPCMLDRWQVCGTCRPVDPEHPGDLTSAPWPCKTVRQLGTEFDGHPAYREAWKP